MKTSPIYFVMILLLSASLTMAQSSDEAKTSFAILGGVNFQNLNGKDAGENKLENDLILGFHAGVNAQIPIAPEFFFQPGLMFSTKGAKNTTGALTSTYKLSYVELPLNVVYKGALGNGFVMIGLGPYVGYGILGKAKFEGGSANLDTDIEFKNIVESTDPLTTIYFKALDAGGNIFFGYETAGGIFFQLNAQMGMLEINPEDNRITANQSSIKNTGFGLSLGYRF